MNNYIKYLIIFVSIPSFAFANKIKNYPNLSGDILYQVQADRIISSRKRGISTNNAFIYIQPNFDLKFNYNWSAKTQWRLQPNNVLTTRDQNFPERYRTLLSDDRGLNINDSALIVEELKINFQNEDMQFSAGKFDPSFGTAHRKSKRIGVFASQFAEDYNLREKLGANIVAILENSQIGFSTFFNDTTGLSESAINNRGRASNKSLAGSTSSLSSYSVFIEGEKLIGIKNLFYNFGYRSLGVESGYEGKRESAYVIGSEYLYKLGTQTSLIPFFETVSFNNFNGESGRRAIYNTLALIGKYGSWTASSSMVNRYSKNSASQRLNFNDRQLQFSIGYKFTNNLTIDVSRADIKEDRYSAALFGTTISYVTKF